MPSDTKIATDHDEIRRWAEDRNGSPAIAKGSEGAGGINGVLFIDFQDADSAAELDPISWEDWFAQFDALDVALQYGDDRGDDEFRLVSRTESARAGRYGRDN